MEATAKSPNKNPEVRRNRIRVLREQSRLTQEELATLTGFALSTVNKHETRARGLTEDAVTAYAKVFKVKTFEIFVDPAKLEGENQTEAKDRPEFKSGYPAYAAMGVGS